jgi:hypothetical protein
MRANEQTALLLASAAFFEREGLGNPFLHTFVNFAGLNRIISDIDDLQFCKMICNFFNYM